MEYKDGARKNFLYTRGTADHPSQKLRDMLRYMEDTTDDNVTNQEIASVQRIVTRIRHKREVEIAYMKSWERERMIRKEAAEEGLAEGRERGLIEGRTEGIEEKTKDVVQNMLKRGMPEEEICALAECTQEFVDMVKDNIDPEKV